MSFPLYFDEDQNEKVATRLAKGGYAVLTTKDAGLANIRTPDEDQLAFAAGQSRAIVTNNAGDYYALYRKWWDEGRQHSGIIIVTARKAPFEIYEGLVRLQELHPTGIENLIFQI